MQKIALIISILQVFEQALGLFANFKPESEFNPK